MLKKFFIAIVLGLVLTCGSGFAATEAEMEQMMAAARAMMANEPPLNQTDIDSFIKMAPQIMVVAEDPNAIFKLYQDNNVSPQRFGIVSSKITVGLAMAQGATREQLGAGGADMDFMIPNDAELKLIIDNAEELINALSE